MMVSPASKGGTGFGLTLIAILLSSGTVLAQSTGINLVAPDGSIDISGDLLEFTNDTYVIATPLGDLRIAADRVRCKGDGCPAIAPVAAAIAPVVFAVAVDGGPEQPEPENVAPEIEFAAVAQPAVAPASPPALLIEAVNVAGSSVMATGIVPILMEGYAGSLNAEIVVTPQSDGTRTTSVLVGEVGYGDDLAAFLVEGSDTGAGFAALLDGSADIAMAARRIAPAEARALGDAGIPGMTSPRNERLVAVDNIMVIAHPENTVARLTMQQVAEIYAGKIGNWSEVGGDDLPIMVVGGDGDPDGSAIFYDTLTTEAGPFERTPELVEAPTVNDIADLVAANPGAIGYVSAASRRGAKALDLVNGCGLVMTPDAFSARTEEYPLQRRLYLYKRGGDISAEGEGFLDYAASPDADALIRKAGFIDLGIDARPQSAESERALRLLDPAAPYEAGIMAEMRDRMEGFERLSTTFRFGTGSADLDERGAQDMARLLDHLVRQPAGGRVAFVGFTDARGAFDGNRNLSLVRSTQVLETFRALAGDRLAGLEMTAEGFGEIAPAACNTDDDGRAINRRVEVWLGPAG